MALYLNYVFSIFSFLGFVLVMIPLPWHIKAWNTGTCLYMIWAGMGCLNYSINSIIWNGNAINWSPVWCDISSRIIIGISTAIHAAALCISRRLYYASRRSPVHLYKADKRRAVLVDLSIGLGIPVLAIAFYYIPEGHRFNIYEEIGCFPATYNTWVAYVLVMAFPLALGLVSTVYSALSIMSFGKYCAHLREFGSTQDVELNISFYIRLVCIAGIEILVTIPLSIYVMVLNSKHISPWISWQDTSWHFSQVWQVPALLGRVPGSDFSRWITVFCAFVIFGFSGFAAEARVHYRMAYRSVTKSFRPSPTVAEASRCRARRQTILATDDWNPLPLSFARPGQNRPEIDSSTAIEAITVQ